MRSSDGSQIFLSLVVPVFNEQDSLRTLHDEIQEATRHIVGGVEIIYINDGSSDQSLDILMSLSKARVLSFPRNLGKSQALQAGFDAARGKYIITMDSDLQDDPKEVQNFLLMLERADLVVGWKQKRLDPRRRKFASRVANGTVRMLTGLRVHDMNCGFKAYRAHVAKSLRLYGDMHRYIPAIIHGQGFRVIEMAVHHRSRQYGKSKYGAGRFIKSAFDFITFLFLQKFFDRPMHFFGLIGVLFGLFGGAITVYLIGLKFFTGALIGGRPLLLFGVLFIVVGGQVLSLGFLGELILRMRGADERAYVLALDHENIV